MATFSSLPRLGSSWGHGYFTGGSYGSFCFRELAPNWLDIAILSQRYIPPRSKEGSAFSYLELGSGMGLGLCLLAAAYPEATFVGVDFHPSHIAHSQWLSSELRLANIQFYEADFLAMAASPAQVPFDPCSRFHYVAAHGILSWVSPEVRQAVLAIAAAFLKPGGVFYCSYNTYPGWLERSAFKSLVDLERQRLGAGQMESSLARASEALTRLLHLSDGEKAPLSLALPRLASQLQTIADIRMPEYLAGEYGAECWNPFYVGDVHRQAIAHKLSFVASASLPENHPGLLPPSLAAIISDESDALIRQALLDLAINQSFRRDLFVKGPLPLSRTAQHQRLAMLQLRLTTSTDLSEGPSKDGITIDTSLGVMGDDHRRFKLIENMLVDQPATLAEIHQQIGIPPDDLSVLTSLMLHSGRVSLDRGSAIEMASTSCAAVNQRLMDLMQGGHNLGFLAAPAVGHGAQPFSLIDAFTLDGIRQGLDGDVLTSCVWMGLDAAGIQLSNSEDGLLDTPQQCINQIGKHITHFRSMTLPLLIQLGIQPSTDSAS